MMDGQSRTNGQSSNHMLIFSGSIRNRKEKFVALRAEYLVDNYYTTLTAYWLLQT